MRRATLGVCLGLGLALAVADLAACNAISGVGDFSFGSSSATSSASGSTGGHGSSSSGAGGNPTTGSGGAGGAALTVPCLKKECPVAPNAEACCYDNTVTHAAEDGRCVVGKPGEDGCKASDDDAGRETRIECHVPSDCPDGKLCCGQRIDNDAGAVYYRIVACETSCPSPNLQLCDSASTCPVGPDGGLSCTQSDILPAGYLVCK